MFERVKNKFSFWIYLAFIAVLIISQIKTIREKDSANPYPIAWDVYGYYLYLPATFIYHDLGLQKNDWINKTREHYKPSTTFYQVAAGKGNKKVIIYNIGYSFVFAPAFFIANTFASTFGFSPDGFSKPYQLALIITAFVFSLIGAFMIRKIALVYFTDKIVTVITSIIFFGTNYFFQACFDGVMPHNILFTLNCFILWFSIKWNEQKKIKHIILLGCVLGLASICRPTELVWIIIPLLINVTSKEEFIEKLKFLFVEKKQIIVFLSILFCFLSIQFIYIKYASGNFIDINLHTETFSFLKPYTFKFLFSYKKGWLLYTPIMIFPLIGFYHLYKKNKNLFYPLFLFFIINLYVVSSWDCWWYATSFSQRSMVETYSMMFVPLGYFLTSIYSTPKLLNKILLSIPLALLVFLNLFQTWQYLNYIIDGERMTKKYYWEVFGKSTIDYDSKKYLAVDRAQTTFTEDENYSEKYFKKEGFNLTFEENGDINKSYIIDSSHHEGKHCYFMNDKNQFSPAFKQAYGNITTKSYVWLKASVWVYLTAPYTEGNSCLVISTEANGKSYKYLSSNYNNNTIKPFIWTQIHLDYITPVILHSSDNVVCYFWNEGGKPLLIDDLHLDIYEPKVDYE